MVDITAEIQRLSKRINKMQKEYDGLVARLSSPEVCIASIISRIYYCLCFSSSQEVDMLSVCPSLCHDEQTDFS